MIDLRSWQKNAVEDALEEFKRNNHFLIQAVTGAGKTTAGAMIAKHLLDIGAVPRVVVLTPSVEIAAGWCDKFASLGINATKKLDLREFAMSRGADVQALVLTYQGATALRGVPGALLILDEIHHAERERGWGEAVESIARDCGKILALTGTPWRSAGEIACLNQFYEDVDGGKRIRETGPDVYSYPYQTDLRQSEHDRATVAAIFTYYESRAIIQRDDGEQQIILPGIDKEDEEAVANYISDKTLYDSPVKPHVVIDDELLSNNHMARTMIADARRKLADAQDRTDGAAKALVVARDVQEARRITRYLEDLGELAECIASDDEEAAARLREIAKGKARHEPVWIVSCKMVSEGVDIPAIKVIVYLSPLTTTLFLVQVTGRALRRVRVRGRYLDSHLFGTPAQVLMPAHPRFVEFGREIERIGNQVVRDQRQKEDNDAAADATIERTQEKYFNAGGDRINELSRGWLYSDELVWLKRFAPDLLTPNVEAAIHDLKKSGKDDVAATIVSQLCEKAKQGGPMRDAQQSQDVETYDDRDSRVRKQLERLSRQIRRACPEARALPDNEAFREVNRKIGKRALGKFKSRDSMSLAEKERCVEAARQWLEQIKGQEPSA